MHPSLKSRPDLRSESGNALARELGQLATRCGLRGAVLISFTRDDRVGVNSSGEPDIFSVAMEKLGDQILAAIGDGKFDPDPQLEASIGLAAGRG